MLVAKEEMDNDSLEDSSKITPEINNATENETQQVFFEGDSLSIQDNFSDIDDDVSDSLEKKYSDPGVENENKINEEKFNTNSTSEEKFESCKEEIEVSEAPNEKKSEEEVMNLKKDENETVKEDDPPSISSGTTEGPEEQDEIDFDQVI